jgi:uncharacterized protein YidB (DUF937 family)
MGLLDILNGMQNGPRGQAQPTSSGSSGGMSPITMALIGLLAYKAMKSFGGSQSGSVPGGVQPNALPGNTASTGGGLGDILGGLLGGKPAGGVPGGSMNTGQTGGGLGDLLGGLLGGRTGGAPAGGLPGGLGGLLAGAGAGTVLSGGLGNLLKDLQNNGQGRAAQSWVGKGENEEIEPDDLAKALGADTINALTAQTGMSRDDLLEGLSQQLPQVVDQLTPDGRLPTEHEAARW